MQTFLPYKSYRKSMECLDKSRLGNQVWREGLTLLRGKWKNHPASKMWRGHEYHLALYLLDGCDVLENRYNKKYDSVREKILVEMKKFKDTGPPKWLGNKKFHDSHKSNLLKKNKEWYSQFNWNVPDNLEYVWPVNKEEL